MRLAFVVPRYGDDVVGGAETLARGLAEHLPRETYTAEILTTCAKSHFTWENYYPERAELYNGLEIRRFRVNVRDISAFIDIQRKIEDGIPTTIDEQLLWAKESVNSDNLYDYIWRNGKDYDYLIFLPYLFGTTFWGSQIFPEKSLLIPCLHNEVYSKLSIFRITFEKVRGVIFNSEPEGNLARRLFPIEDKAMAIVGMGFDSGPDRGYDPVRFRKKLRIGDDYILYFGRKEGGKNLPLLLDYFCRLKRETGMGLKLIIAGDGEARIPDDMKNEVIDMGFLSERDKIDAVAGAIFVCQPSVNESFSIVIMEAWLTGVPVLVHGYCDVTKWHVVESGGGLYFRDYYEFAEVTGYLVRNPGVREKMGERGRRYVQDRYSWPAVIERFDSALKDFSNA
ncbi:MAG: glycosyltransferase family 4 protein [Nitrospirota bacterium]